MKRGASGDLSRLLRPSSVRTPFDVATDDADARAQRYRILSFGRDGDDAREIVDMELIWMTAIARGGLDPKGLITALEGGVPREGGYDEAALEEGVDYRVAAYFAGGADGAGALRRPVQTR